MFGVIIRILYGIVLCNRWLEFVVIKVRREVKMIENFQILASGGFSDQLIELID